MLGGAATRLAILKKTTAAAGSRCAAFMELRKVPINEINNFPPGADCFRDSQVGPYSNAPRVKLPQTWQ